MLVAAMLSQVVHMHGGLSVRAFDSNRVDFTAGLEQARLLGLYCYIESPLSTLLQQTLYLVFETREHHHFVFRPVLNALNLLQVH